jgi:putative addiction module component (TIGR02574 family)
MSSNLYDEIVKLDAATRLQLAQSILDSVASEAFAPSVTDCQRAEVNARLTHHRENPEEETVSLADIKAKLGLSEIVLARSLP